MTESIVVASINLLGDAYNALEFMEPASNSPQFSDNYEKVRAALMSLTSKEVLDECGALGLDAKTELKHDIFVDNCSSEFLRRDNKLSLSCRANLIVGGMVPTSCDGTNGPLFRHAKKWRKLLQARQASYFEDELNMPILLWDVACSLAAERALREYTFISEASYLNPERLVGNAGDLMEPLSGHELAVVAAQEFPSAGSGKFNALQEVMTRKKLTFVECGDVGFVYSASLQVQSHAESPLGTSAPAVVAAINASLSDLPEIDLSDDDLCRLETSFRKTIVLDVAPDLRFINVHVKELKSAAGTRFLARYLRALTDETRDNVILSDTNIPDAAKVACFQEGCKECGLRLLTKPGLLTTRKQRTELHGQLPDKNKCLKVVEAQKDFILCRSSKGRWGASSARAFPDLNADASLLIPNSAWAADHCMVTTVLTANLNA